MKTTKKPFSRTTVNERKARRRGKKLKLVSPTQFTDERSGRVVTLPPGDYFVTGDLTRIR